MTSAAELKDLIQIAMGAAPKNITLWTESDQVVQRNLLTFLSSNAISIDFEDSINLAP
jgi:hypothetical protein